jgi:hypothetical protein
MEGNGAQAGRSPSGRNWPVGECPVRSQVTGIADTHSLSAADHRQSVTSIGGNVCFYENVHVGRGNRERREGANTRLNLPTCILPMVAGSVCANPVVQYKLSRAHVLGPDQIVCDDLGVDRAGKSVDS